MDWIERYYLLIFIYLIGTVIEQFLSNNVHLRMDGHNNNGNNTTTVTNNNNNNYRKYKRGNSNPKTKKQLENELNRQRSFYVASPQNQSTHNAQV